MSQGLVHRPKAPEKKIHSKNEFELCYLRHQYIRKVDHNPTKNEMKPYTNIASHMAKNTWFTYKNLLGMVGFDLEDVVSIAHIHLISFLGLFTLDKMPEKYEEFVAAHNLKFAKNPQEEDKMNKNKANCTMFLKQRMEDLIRVCRQKARNIKGLPTEEHFFYFGPKRPPRYLRVLIENYEKLGFRKLDTAVYKSIRKRIKPDDGPVFKFNGNYYIAVPVEQKCLSLADFCGAGLDPYDSIHNMTPEQIFFAKQESVDWDKRKEEFDRKSKSSKAETIRKFIQKNKQNPIFKEEIKVARKMLRTIGA